MLFSIFSQSHVFLEKCVQTFGAFLSKYLFQNFRFFKRSIEIEVLLLILFEDVDFLADGEEEEEEEEEEDEEED